MNVLERFWSSRSVRSGIVRAALTPFELLYRAVVAARGALYDAGVLKVHDVELPVISVGNLSVGGTGKTPVASWIADQLRRRGGRPSIVMRGYGGDEPMVHAILNPGIAVIVAPNRELGVRRAQVMTADVSVLDDGFQHRRVRRDVDVVLLSAEQWQASHRLLPAGPLREPLGALRRATLIIVTRKAASEDAARRVEEQVTRLTGSVPTAVVHLAPSELRSLRDPGRIALDALKGRSLLVIAAIGDPQSFVRQMEALAGTVRTAIYRDHHRFSREEAITLATSVRPDELAVCTLKDAVKLDTSWPRDGAPLWYVSQRLIVERGQDAIDRALDDVLRARQRTHS